ncbi:MAG: hypothetical protein HZA18_01955 [Nitrospirae bacterium]|nr:hypothetical protein [Nitrospirota bacterium]
MAKHIEAVETEEKTKRRELIGEIIKYNEEDLKATWKVLDTSRHASRLGFVPPGRVPACPARPGQRNASPRL